MKAFKPSSNLDKNKVFILNRSGLDQRFDPQYYHFERRLQIENLRNSGHKLLPLIEVAEFSKNLLTSNPNNLPYLGLEDIESNTGVYLGNSEKGGFGTALRFTKGDVLFPKLRPYLNKVHFAEFDGVCSTEFTVLKSRSMNPKFLSAYLRSPIVLNQVKHMMSGNTLPRLQTEDVRSLLVPIPSKEIQEKVVSLIDEAYSQKKCNEAEAEKLLAGIDDYLMKELNVMLPEQNNGLGDRIFQLNFRELEGRLDPFYYITEFKEIEANIIRSGSCVVALENLFLINRGGSPRPIDKFYTEEESGVNWIKIGDTKNDDKYIYSTKQKIKPEGAHFSRKVEIGDFILSNSMSFGRPYIMKISGYIHDGWLLFRPKTTSVDNDYLYSILSSKLIYRLFKKATIGGVVDNLNIDLVKKIKIPLPSLPKQQEIARHITNIRKQAQELKDQTKSALEQANKKIEEILLGS